MYGKQYLAMQAMSKALMLREKQNISIIDPVNVFDFVEKLNIELRFVDIPSMEGMYTRKGSKPIILLSSHRPPGRQTYNCAHELAHHVFEHGDRVDQLIEENKLKRGGFDPDEYLADRFASFLLMPKTLVCNAFHLRNWAWSQCTPQQVYMIAGWLGVGYTTLITHMASSLGLISAQESNRLLKATPKSIRTQILGQETKDSLIIVDNQWRGRSIDIQVDELILLPVNTLSESKCVQHIQEYSNGSLYKGIAPGIGRFTHQTSGWASYVRVARRSYVGRSIFRHLEDPEHDKGVGFGQ